ncbi:GntR family transcriptional regulator [Phytoactinopolyspora halotolerans]|uniref:GntR family transcriptional regulator n=1 Tax=Phytoactinopolyspora halotolerans TaxID=1981512 RepID=A0A6L9S958_9ACTN|nr:GntR family transcriptional regulator [Phytoactinopolyspora halotolerans]NEE00500.1 GntR family transcriptional regulator [Phytoactinopolyspora halotolerans]
MAARKFREIADRVAAEIAGLPPGTRIAGESEIGERFGVGRAAARAALLELQRRMLVRRVQGVGTFTARRIDYLISPNHAPSWSQTVRESGSVPSTVVRSCEITPMPDDVAGLLGYPPGAPCHLLRRRSFTDDLPAAWGLEWVPTDVVGELAVAVQHFGSLHVILRDMAGAEPQRAWSRASLETTEADVATELGCAPGDAAWLVESLNHDARTGRLLCLTRRWMRADAVRLIIESGTTPAPPLRSATEPPGP